MVQNRKVTGTASSIPFGILIGGSCSALITLVGAFIASWMINREMIPETAVGYASLMILLIASAAGAWTAVIKIKHRRMQVCLLNAITYYLLLLCVTALFFGGQYTGMGVTALAVLGGSMTVALMGINGKQRTKRPRYPSR